MFNTLFDVRFANDLVVSFGIVEIGEEGCIFYLDDNTGIF